MFCTLNHFVIIIMSGHSAPSYWVVHSSSFNRSWIVWKQWLLEDIMIPFFIRGCDLGQENPFQSSSIFFYANSPASKGKLYNPELFRLYFKTDHLKFENESIIGFEYSGKRKKRKKEGRKDIKGRKECYEKYSRIKGILEK